MCNTFDKHECCQSIFSLISSYYTASAICTTDIHLDTEAKRVDIRSRKQWPHATVATRIGS